MPMNNEERAAYAREALTAYCAAKEGRNRYEIIPTTQAEDLICDLLHLARRIGDNPLQKIATALTNFEAEEWVEK